MTQRFDLGNWAKKYEATRSALADKYGANFDKPSPLKFGMSIAEYQIIRDWEESLKPEILAIQKRNKNLSDISDIIGNEPYYGAAGGGLTYSFIPTGLGTIITVTEAITGKTLNVSDAADWYFYG